MLELVELEGLTEDSEDELLVDLEDIDLEDGLLSEDEDLLMVLEEDELEWLRLDSEDELLVLLEDIDLLDLDDSEDEDRLIVLEEDELDLLRELSLELELVEREL